MESLDSLRFRVQQELKKSLEEKGWRKRKGGVYTIAIDEQILAWLSVDALLRKREELVRLVPLMGLRNEQLELLLSAFLERKVTPLSSPSIVGNLGYLTSQDRYIEWEFKPGCELGGAITNLVLDIQDSGLDFVAKNVHPEILAQTMKMARFTNPEYTKFQIPILLILSSQIEKAKAEVEERLAGFSDPSSQVAMRYHQFANNFFAYLKSRTG